MGLGSGFWKYSGFVCVLAAGLSAVGRPALAGHVWRVYEDPSQHLKGCYPADLFGSVDPPLAGEPEHFAAADGAGAEMYITRDEAGKGLAQQMREAEDMEFEAGGKPVFQMARPGFYLFVGFAGGDVVYEKAVLAAGYFETFRMVYPRALRRNYDLVAARMARCFGAG